MLGPCAREDMRVITVSNNTNYSMYKYFIYNIKCILFVSLGNNNNNNNNNIRIATLLQRLLLLSILTSASKSFKVDNKKLVSGFLLFFEEVVSTFCL